MLCNKPQYDHCEGVFLFHGVPCFRKYCSPAQSSLSCKVGTGEVHWDGPPNLQDFFFAACDLSCHPAFVFIMGQCVKKHQVSSDCHGTVRVKKVGRQLKPVRGNVFSAVVFLILSNFLLSWTAFIGRNKHVREEGLFVSDKREIPASSAATTVHTKDADTTRKATDSVAVAETIVPILSEKSFDRLPQWDFEDVYSQDAPPRHTVSML